MAITHATIKAPGQRLFAGADWNIAHVGTAAPDTHGNEAHSPLFVCPCYVQTSTTSLTGTTETSILGTGVGSLQLPKNLLKAGTSVKIKIFGYLTAAAMAGTLRLKFQGQTFFAQLILSGATYTAQGFEIDLMFTCRKAGAAGTAIGSMNMKLGSDLGAANEGVVFGTTSPGTISNSTTAVGNIDVTWQWAGTGNTIITILSEVEVIN